MGLHTSFQRGRRARSWRAFIEYAAAVAFLILQSACGGTEATSSGCTVNSVSASASPIIVNPGATVTVTATVSATAQCSGGVDWSFTPSGGATLTSSGRTATFTSTVPGTYTILATSKDDPTKGGAVTVTIKQSVPPS